MELKIIHHTIDLCDPENRSGSYSVDDMVTLAGREAGICYMAEDYFSGKINNSTTALKRANVILGTGHHSPFDHASIGVEISGIPKILAMLLNSTEFYTTSEKSARYTVMKPNNPRELEIYTKWREIFKDLIFHNYPDMDVKQGEKLALENARYMLSVFTPTSMGFTTTFRQYSYMYYWLNDFVDNIKRNKSDSIFYNKLIPYCEELAKLIYPITNGIVTDHKGQGFNFMPEVYGYDIPDTDDTDDGMHGVFGNVYEVNYKNSFAYLAQAQRHRTLHYEMAEPTGGCYVPEILIEGQIPDKYIGTDLMDEWIRDFNELAIEFPQCSLVRIYESGSAHNFLLKCKERLCGRAQLEIADRTADLMSEFMRANLNRRNTEAIKNMTGEGFVVPKCGFQGYKCKEPCRWGVKYGVDRLI